MKFLAFFLALTVASARVLRHGKGSSAEPKAYLNAKQLPIIPKEIPPEHEVKEWPAAKIKPKDVAWHAEGKNENAQVVATVEIGEANKDESDI